MKTTRDKDLYIKELDNYAELASFIIKSKPSQITISYEDGKVMAALPVAFKTIRENTIER